LKIILREVIAYMKKKPFGKILVIGLTILFTGASVLPSISAIYKTNEVPTLFEGQSYFILLCDYTDGAGQDNIWAVQLRFDSINQVVESEYDSITLPLIMDQWTEIRIDIDLNGDWMEIYYNGTFLIEKQWTATINNDFSGILNIDAVDLFANGATSVYYDDMSIEQVGVGVVWSENFDTYAAGSSMHGQGGWKGWDNDPTWTAYVSNAESLSPENSVDIKVDADLVHEYSGYTSGEYIYIAWVYIPSDTGEPPGAPVIGGPDGGKAGTEYDFTFNAVDPDENTVKFTINWGDDSTVTTTAFTGSGEDIVASHTWAEEGVYTITAYAEDSDGMMGPDATKDVNMPRSKAIITLPFLNWLQCHPNMFPILQLLIQKFGLQ
jgi:hypothetical protein